jgi:outer membrane lipoprotein-sorting protein
MAAQANAFWRAGLAAAAVVLAAALAWAEGASPVPTQPATKPAATAPSKELLKHVQDKLHSVDTVEADFTQEKTLAMFDHTLTISGHFAIEKPSKLVWIVKKPVRYAVLIQGSEIHQWDEDTNKTQVIQLGNDPVFKAVTAQINAWFLGDYEVLLKTFAVELVKEKPLVLGFVPLKDSVPSKMLKRIEMTFGKDESYIDNMFIEEVDGDSTRLKFIDPKLNEKIKKEVWEIPPRD